MDHALCRADRGHRGSHPYYSSVEEQAGTRARRRHRCSRPRRRSRSVPRAGPQGDRFMTIELLCCILAAAASLFYIFYLPGSLYLGPEKTRASYLRERKDAVYENLRDLNFEYKAGKVPDADYQNLKSSLEDEAATLLAEIARLESIAPAPRKARS